MVHVCRVCLCMHTHEVACYSCKPKVNLKHHFSGVVYLDFKIIFEGYVCVHVCQCRPAIVHELEDSCRSLPSSLLETISCLMILAGQWVSGNSPGSVSLLTQAHWITCDTCELHSWLYMDPGIWIQLWMSTQQAHYPLSQLPTSPSCFFLFLDWFILYVYSSNSFYPLSHLPGPTFLFLCLHVKYLTLSM